MNRIQTLWCPECAGPSDVVEEGRQTDPNGVDWWVATFDCGHEETFELPA